MHDSSNKKLLVLYTQKSELTHHPETDIFWLAFVGAFACEMMNMLIRKLGDPVSTRLGGTQFATLQVGLSLVCLLFLLFCLCPTQANVRTQSILSVNKSLHH